MRRTRGRTRRGSRSPRIEIEQRAADEQLNGAQRRLFEARESDAGAVAAHRRSQGGARRRWSSAPARSASRCSGSRRPARELETRVSTRAEELQRNASAPRASCSAAIARRRRQLDDGAAHVRRAARAGADRRRGVADAARRVRSAGSRASARRAARSKRVRAEAAQLEVARATAEADLTHLAASCVDTVQATLDEVAAEVDAARARRPARQPQGRSTTRRKPRRSRTRTGRRAGGTRRRRSPARTSRPRGR